MQSIIFKLSIICPGLWVQFSLVPDQGKQCRLFFFLYSPFALHEERLGDQTRPDPSWVASDLCKNRRSGFTPIPEFVLQPLSHIMNIITISSGGRTPPDYSASSRVDVGRNWLHVSRNKQPLEHCNLIAAANFLQWNKSRACAWSPTSHFSRRSHTAQLTGHIGERLKL